MAAGVPERLEVVRDGSAVEAISLGGQRIVEELSRAELLRRGLVAERDHRAHSTLRFIEVSILIPVKRLDDAKQRLAPALGADDRRDLMTAMIRHVAHQAREARVGPVAIATSDGTVAALAGELRVGAVSDGALPWNEGLEHARRLLDASAEAVLYLAADLPLVTAQDVRALAAAASPGTVVIGRARDGGTNALAVNPAGAMTPCFGEVHSSDAHAAAGERAGLRVVVLDVHGVALDVDTLDDARDAGLLS